MENSLERINPRFITQNDQHTLELHLERYKYAGMHLAPGVIADIACGVGYGSHLLATNFGEKIQKIAAVDNDLESIKIANTFYNHPKISYINEDALRFHGIELFNSAISLETIEHLEKPAQFIKHIAAQLARHGRFIASVPVTPSMDGNPFHLHDFTEKSFKELFYKAGFKLLDQFMQKQPFSPAIIAAKTSRNAALRKNLLQFYLQNPDKLLLRLQSLFKDGFCNKYLVCVFEKVT